MSKPRRHTPTDKYTPLISINTDGQVFIATTDEAKKKYVEETTTRLNNYLEEYVIDMVKKIKEKTNITNN